MSIRTKYDYWFELNLDSKIFCELMWSNYRKEGRVDMNSIWYVYDGREWGMKQRTGLAVIGARHVCVPSTRLCKHRSTCTLPIGMSDHNLICSVRRMHGRCWLKSRQNYDYCNWFLFSCLFFPAKFYIADWACGFLSVFPCFCYILPFVIFSYPCCFFLLLQSALFVVFSISLGPFFPCVLSCFFLCNPKRASSSLHSSCVCHRNHSSCVSLTYNEVSTLDISVIPSCKVKICGNILIIYEP